MLGNSLVCACVYVCMCVCVCVCVCVFAFYLSHPLLSTSFSGGMCRKDAFGGRGKGRGES